MFIFIWGIIFIASLLFFRNFYLRNKSFYKENSIFKIPNDKYRNVIFPPLLVIFLSLFIGGLQLFDVGGNNNSSKSVNIQNENDAIQHIQGKWNGTFYLRVAPFSEVDIRVLIEGNRVTTWHKFKKDINTGNTLNKKWSEISKKLENEEFALGYLREDRYRDLLLRNKPLSSGFLYIDSNSFMVQGHKLKRGWD